jgi:hypothetical protein
MANKTELNAAELDSHRATMNIHLETALRLMEHGAWTTAKTSLELALPHANVLKDKEARSKIFSKMNTARAGIRRDKATETANAAA